MFWQKLINHENFPQKLKGKQKQKAMKSLEKIPYQTNCNLQCIIAFKIWFEYLRNLSRLDNVILWLDLRLITSSSFCVHRMWHCLQGKFYNLLDTFLWYTHHQRVCNTKVIVCFPSIRDMERKFSLSSTIPAQFCFSHLALIPSNPNVLNSRLHSLALKWQPI